MHNSNKFGSLKLVECLHDMRRLKPPADLQFLISLTPGDTAVFVVVSHSCRQRRPRFNMEAQLAAFLTTFFLPLIALNCLIFTSWPTATRNKLKACEEPHSLLSTCHATGNNVQRSESGAAVRQIYITWLWRDRFIWMYFLSYYLEDLSHHSQYVTVYCGTGWASRNMGLYGFRTLNYITAWTNLPVHSHLTKFQFHGYAKY